MIKERVEQLARQTPSTIERPAVLFAELAEPDGREAHGGDVHGEMPLRSL